MLHRFWTCPHSILFWKVLSFEKRVLGAIPPESVRFHSELATWLMQWLADASEQEKELTIQAVYGLWLARNKTREGKKIADPKSVADYVYSHAMKWAVVHERREKVHSEALVVKWTPPEEGWLKANADGARSKLQDRGGGGVVV